MTTAKKKTKKPLTVAEMASMGGKARAASLTASQRKEIAKNAIRKRWELQRAKDSKD